MQQDLKKQKKNIVAENKKVKQNILENKKGDCIPKEEKKMISLDSGEKTKKLDKIKETLEARIINLQWSM